MKKLLFAAYVLMLPLITSGCATVINASMQNISIQTREQSGANVAGALCELKNNEGKWLVITPGSAIIHRSNDDLQVLCSKDSFAPGRATVVSGIKGTTFGNIILGGGVGAILDHNNGSAYEYPGTIQIVMGGFSKIEAPKVVTGIELPKGQTDPQNNQQPSLTAATFQAHLMDQANEKELEASKQPVDSSLAYVTNEGAPRNTDKKIEAYQKAAARGDAEAQYMLGLAYATGDGVPKDATHAIEWYQQAAVQGNAPAQHMLGLVYASGKGVPKDAAKAAHWYMKAAAQGNAPAQYQLGVAYANNEGISRDLVRAYAWFDLAAAKGNKEARRMRDALAKNISYAQIAEGQRLASDWRKGDIF